MKRLKTALFLATAASSAMFAPMAQAQVTNIPQPALNDGERAIHGAGASSIQNVLVQEFNCIAKHNDLGVFTSTIVPGTLKTLAEPTNLPTSFNCATQELEPNANAKYLSTGSGSGRTAWLASTNTFGVGNPLGTWNTVQFAFSDSPASSTDFTNYTNNVSSVAGPAVQFPKYVLPVAIAYNPQYGVTNTGTPLLFNVMAPQQILGVDAGGLRLNAQTYCRIFNGDIKNWNSSEITADNGGTSLKASADNQSRWDNEGVPIRIVGRVDRSGTTDIFTRHLAAVCDALTVSTNKYDNAAETLPYDRSSGSTAPNFSGVRSDTGLNPSSTATAAGTITSVSPFYFDNSGLPASWHYTNVVTNTTATGNDTVSGTATTPLNGLGLYIVAAGSQGVSDAVNFAPDADSKRAGFSGWKFNGKLGYIGADFIPPAPSASGLFAAALKHTAGAGGTYLMPSAANGVTAAASTRAPQTASNGTFDSTDGGRGLSRANPADWYSALYSPSATLANPSSGYAITGTTQFLGYTCYKAGNLESIQNFIGWNTGFVNQDWDFNDRTGVFTDSTGAVSSSGLLPRSNIGAMPANWQNAIIQAFLTGGDSLGLAFGNAGDCAGKTGR